MFTYLKKDIAGHYVEFEEKLDPELYDNIGTTYEDYKNNKWVLLDEDQLAFKEEHPTATIEEIINKAINPITPAQARRSKNSELSTYYYDNYNKFTVNDEQVWLNSTQRLQKRDEVNRALAIGKSTVKIGTQDIDPNLVNHVIDLIAKQESNCQSWLTQKQLEINTATEVEDIQAIVVNEGLPVQAAMTTESLQKLDNEEEKTSFNRQMMSYMALHINELTASDNDKTVLSMKMLYPVWGKKGAEFGKSVAVGFKLRHENKLFKVRQQHQLQENWAPGIDTAALYEEINETHAGTLEDPIPYSGNMRLELGKYYSQNGVTYKCIRDTVIPVYDDLATLATVGGGSYVEKVE